MQRNYLAVDMGDGTVFLQRDGLMTASDSPLQDIERAVIVLHAENARLSAELAALKEAMGPVIADMKSTIEILGKHGWPSFKRRLLGVSQDLLLGQLIAAVAAFDRAGEVVK